MSGENIVRFPTSEQFQVFLSEQKDVIFTSSIKSYFRYITSYFRDKPFTQDNLRVMLNKLRTCPDEKGKCLKKSTLNKYIRVTKLIARCMRIHEFDDYEGYRCHDEESAPKGDIITDKEAKLIAEVRMKYGRRSREQIEQLNLKYRAVFTLMRFVGTPPIDVVNLKWCNDKGTHLEYYRHKTHKHMIVPIPPPLRRCLDALPHSSELMFSIGKEETIREEIKRRCLRLKIKRQVTAYSFRYMATAYSYMGCTADNMIHLADVFGHTVEVAKRHYDKMKDPQVLMDALSSSHPGLKKNTSIDSIKRLAYGVLGRLVDMSKFEIELTITPKQHNVRHLHIS